MHTLLHQSCPGCSLFWLSQVQYSAAAGGKSLQGFWCFVALLPPRASGEELGLSRVSRAMGAASPYYRLLAPCVQGAVLALLLHTQWRLLMQHLPVGTHVSLGLWFGSLVPCPAPVLCFPPNTYGLAGPCCMGLPGHQVLLMVV